MTYRLRALWWVSAALILASLVACSSLAMLSLTIKSGNRDADLQRIDQVLVALDVEVAVAQDLVQDQYGKYEVVRYFRPRSLPALDGKVFFHPAESSFQILLAETDAGQPGLRKRFSKPADQLLDRITAAMRAEFGAGQVERARSGW